MKKLFKITVAIALVLSLSTFNKEEVYAKTGTTCKKSGRTKTCYTYKNGYKSYYKRVKTKTHKNGKKKYRDYIYKNKTGKYTSYKKYWYNKKGQLKSNKHGSAKRKIYKYWSNGKIKSRTDHKYSKRGKLYAKKYYYKGYLKNKPKPAAKKPVQPTIDKSYKLRYNGTLYSPISYEDGLYEYEVSKKTIYIDKSWFVDGKIFDSVTTKKKLEDKIGLKISQKVSSERMKCGLNGLSTNNTILKDIADIRSVEAEIKYEHTRPDGNNYIELYKEKGLENYGGENLAAKYFYGNSIDSIANNFYTGWYNSKAHRANMFDYGHDDIAVSVNLNLFSGKATYSALQEYDSNKGNNIAQMQNYYNASCEAIKGIR